MKAFVENEFQEVQAEAEEMVEGWSAHVWPQAMQFHTVLINYECYKYSKYFYFMIYRHLILITIFLL